MSDLIKRLRGQRLDGHMPEETMSEAADEIERLHAEIDEYLHEQVDLLQPPVSGTLTGCCHLHKEQPPMSEYSELVNSYHNAREARLAKDRESAELEKVEKKLKAQVIQTLRETKLSALGGDKVILSLKEKKVPTARDWQAIHAWIIANDAWDIMQKRLTETAIRDRWEDGVIIPGIEAFPVDDLSINSR